MNSSISTPTSVTWIPEHPAYGSISMMRYWMMLNAAKLPDDPFTCESVLPLGTRYRPPFCQSAQRVISRRVTYPVRIKLRAKGDIVHILDHSWSDMLPYTPRPALKVITVHDLIPLRFPGELSPTQAGRFRSWISYLSQADVIIADSAYTKQEIEKLLGIDGAKIHVVLLGVELPDLRPSEAGPVFLPPRGTGDGNFRVGSIGSTLKRKNLGIFPAALARLRQLTRRKVVLVRCGMPLPQALAAELRQELGDDGLIELGRLPDAAIGPYYAGLDVVALPSTYEGFGLPVIEGMANGIPVVCSSNTSLPEVGGGNVLYFNPMDSEEFAHRLADVAAGRLPADWTKQAYDRARQFTWRATLEGIYQVYSTLLEQRPTIQHP